MNIERDSFPIAWEYSTYLRICRQEGRITFKDGGMLLMDIIEVKKKLIGYAVWEIDPVTARGHILNLAITESERRKGYGRLLLKHVLANLRESGMSSCFLEVRESNTPARRLYESQGCTESGRLDDYYFDEDAIEYLCDL